MCRWRDASRQWDQEQESLEEEHEHGERKGGGSGAAEGDGDSDSCKEHVDRKPFSANWWPRRCTVLQSVCATSDESVPPAQITLDVVHRLSDSGGVHHLFVFASATFVSCLASSDSIGCMTCFR